MKKEKSGIAFTTQFNEFLGRRHRIWYLVTGLIIAVGVMWIAYQYILLPEVRRSSDRAYDQQAEENHQLRSERDDLKLSRERLRDSLQGVVREYRDSLALLQSFGQYLGDFEMPTTARGDHKSLNLYEPLWGGQVQVMYVDAGTHSAIMSLQIDTCPPMTFSQADTSRCEHFDYRLLLSLHHYSPFAFGRINIMLYLERITDSSVVVKLYQPERID